MNKILYTEEIQTRLKLIQEKFHVSSYEMSTKLGYASKHISSLKVGVNYLTPTFLNNLKSVYGVDINADFSLEEDDAGFRDRLISLKGDQTSAKVAREMGINPYKYIRYEQGVEFPSTKAIRKIADYFDVGVDWLAYGDELAKDYPVNEGMIEFLKKNPEVRKEIWEKYINSQNHNPI